MRGTAAVFLSWVVALSAASDVRAHTPQGEMPVVCETPGVCYHGRGAEYWHFEAKKLRDTVKHLRQRLQQAQHWTGGSMYAISLASSVFRVPYSQMRSVASCETGGTFNPYALNPSSGASGLFQFLRSTWASQGIQGFSVFDPVANALGAARIVAREGWKQWVCRP